MAEIIEKDGCLLEGLRNNGVQAIAHCANAFCTMRSGVAAQIKDQFPLAYQADLTTERGDKSKMGKYSVAELVNGPRYHQQIGNTHIYLPRYIFNIYGQYNYGYDGAQYVDYDALENGLKGVRNFMIIKSVLSLGLPHKIGCCRAGGNWSVIRPMIDRVFEKTKLKVIIYKFNRG